MTASSSNKTWSSTAMFLLASIGSTVGLSNIWKFTYLAGVNGGGAFVLVYLLSLLSMGIPILAAELLLGRRGGRSMVGTLQSLHEKDGLSRHWTKFGWVAMIGVFLILSFYCVIAGMTLDYSVLAIFGQLKSMDREGADHLYQAILASPGRLMLSQAAFVVATGWIVAKGVQGGLEKSTGWMTPALFVILIGLVIYAMVAGEFSAGARFLFKPDFSKITPDVVLAAFGQAFFSLGIGVGVMLTYGAYMPKSTSIIRSATIISFSDGLAAILAGLAIFPIVFKYGLSPTEGPGLIFMTLPVAFGQMPAGSLVGTAFFILLLFAALTSSISLLESIVSHLEEILPYGRFKITWVTTALLFLVGLSTVFSFNVWSDFKPIANKTIFELIDYFGSNLLMPIGGIFMAVLAGWMLSTRTTREILNLKSSILFHIWIILIRYIAPTAVALIMLSNLI